MIDTMYLIAWLEHTSSHGLGTSDLVVMSKLKEVAKAMSLLVSERNMLRAELSSMLSEWDNIKHV